MRGRRRRGQFALLGVIVLAVTLLAIVASRPPEPAFAFERGPMQSAQLIHLARYCLAVGCSNTTLSSLVSSLRAYNASEPLLMYPVLDAYYGEVASSTRVERYVFFIIQTLRGAEAVAFGAAAQSSPVQGRYERVVRGEKLTFFNVTLTYCHVYASPFFPPSGPPCPLSQPLSGIVYCPRLRDPRGVAELTYVGYCVWRVSVPGNYTLYDEFGVPVRVVVP
jgi:hypothetical protein